MITVDGHSLEVTLVAHTKIPNTDLDATSLSTVLYDECQYYSEMDVLGSSQPILGSV